ncbi:MAG: PIG-L family deacetylase, partial [Oscillospiraceae bacterium]
MKKRLGMLALALCMAVIAVSGGALCTKASAAENNTSRAHKTIMIFSPHQDDEANMAEAIIYSNVQKGNDVYVVMGFGGNHQAVTNSDGTCNDSYGVRRLNESTKNLEKLGVQNPQDHIIYLGYHKVDYAATAGGGIAKYSKQGELLRPDNVTPYYTMGDGTEKYGFPYAWMSYHCAKYGEQCTVSEANMQADIVDILKQYKPDEIYSIDFDAHIEHMYMGSVVDTAFGVLKQDPECADYQPRFYESMSYQTAWVAPHDLETVKSPSDSSRKILESTRGIDTPEIRPRNTTLDWKDRVRFPVEKEMSFPDRKQNLGYQAYEYGFGGTASTDKPDKDNNVLGCINGDQVVWERNTQSLSYQATVKVSSNAGDASQINDFSTLRMHMVDFENFGSTNLKYNDYKWSPAPGDTDRTVKLTFTTPQTVGMVKLFDDVSPNNQITSGVLSFSDGSAVDVGALNNNGSATEVSFSAKKDIDWVEFKIKTFAGTGTPGLSEFEVYSAKSARPADFVKIYLDKVNGSKWATESFLYDYPMRVGETEQSVDLGVYRYPSETTDTEYTWSLVGSPQGITLTQAGRLTVGTNATPGEYSITVTSKSQPQLSDTITIDIANSVSIWPGKGTDADPYLISTQEQLAAITTGKSYKLMSDIALSGWASIQEPFAGTFNGNGYTISNLTAPLFKTVLPADAKAVTIKNVNLITTGDFAASVGAVGTVFAAIGNGNESAQITVDNVHATING